MTPKPRKFLAVRLKDEHYDQAQVAADELDLSVTAWVRQLVLAELKRNPPKTVAPAD